MSSSSLPRNEGARLFPNLGAEEGPEWRRWTQAPGPRGVRTLWRLLFGASARELGDDRQTPWPTVLAPPVAAPVFEGLENRGALVPWLSTPEAVERARSEGRPYGAALPEATARVHDKAFAHRVALHQQALPRPLTNAIHVLEPEDLQDPDRAVKTLREKLQDAPDWVGRSFTLKPRWASSGRGRVAGSRDQVDSETLRGSFPRLAARGGAILEPWLDRTRDLSAHWFVQESGAGRLLGTLEQVVSAAGVCRGHRGSVDWRGRIGSDLPQDEPLREASAGAARAAGEAGYHGPLGIDAFVFRRPDDPGRESLRPLVECNARFSMGLVALGLVRRALPHLRGGRGLEPGMRRSFYVAPEAPPGGWREAEKTLATPFERFALGGGETNGPEPCLVVCETPSDLDPLAQCVREGGAA